MSSFLFALSVRQASSVAVLSLFFVPHLYRTLLANPSVPRIYTEMLDKVDNG